MGVEQTAYANKTSEIAQTILSLSLPSNPQEIICHSKNLLNAFGGGKKETEAKETEARRALERLVNMDGLKETTYYKLRNKFRDLDLKNLPRSKRTLFKMTLEPYGISEKDLDETFLLKLDDLIPLRGNRAYVISEMILHPENFPPEFSELLKKNDTFARQLLIKALTSDNDHYETDIKTEWEKRKTKIKTNEELVKKLKEEVTRPDPGGLA